MSKEKDTFRRFLHDSKFCKTSIVVLPRRIQTGEESLSLLFSSSSSLSRGLYCRGHVDSILPFNRLGNKTLASIIYLHYRYFTPTWTRHVFMVKLFSIIPGIWITWKIRPTDKRYNSLNFQKYQKGERKKVGEGEREKNFFLLRTVLVSINTFLD